MSRAIHAAAKDDTAGGHNQYSNLTPIPPVSWLGRPVADDAQTARS